MGWFTPARVEHHIRPDMPFDAEYPLSVVDGVMPKINSRYLFIWDTRTTTADVAVSRAALVKRLEDALQSMLRLPDLGVLAVPELLGTIYEDQSSGSLSLKITKASAISFVISTRDDIHIEHLKPDAGYPRQCMDPNVYATGIEAISLPEAATGSRAFSAQLTFIRGGYVLCVNKHHSLLDATSSSRLVKWWFSKARSLSEEQETGDCLPAAQDCSTMHDRMPLTQMRPVPQRDHPNWRVVPNATPAVFGITLPPLWVMTILKWLPTKLVGETRSHILHFGPASLQRLKKATESTTNTRISTNDALVALVWTSITRARSAISGASQTEATTSSCSVSVNIRSRLTPPLPSSYFGNAVISIATSLPLSTLKNEDASTTALSTAATALRATLSTSTTDASIRSQLQLFASAPKLSDVQMAINLSAGPDIYMNSWEGLFDSPADLHLGYGTFQRMRLPGANAFAGFANVLPAYGMRDVEGGDGVYPGGLEVMLDLRAVEMERLLKDDSFMAFVDKVI